MPKLTKRTVEALVTKSSDYIVFDAALPGFGVRVMPSGRRFFLIQYRLGHRTRRVMLGQFGPTTADIARHQAMRLLGQVKGVGADPAADRDAERSAMSVADLGERFLGQHVAVRCRHSTQLEYKRCVDLFIQPFFKQMSVRAVTTAEVAEFHGGLAHIPYQANRALGVLSKMMSLAEVWGVRHKHSNPCEDVERYPEFKRERFLSMDEVRSLGQALDEYEGTGAESYYAVAAFRLLLLTGCRLGEIQHLEWRFVCLDEAEFRLPEIKTGAKTVHLGAAAVDLLRALPRLRDNPYVIAGKKLGLHLTDLQRPWRKVREMAGLSEVRIHDLRHTFASGGLSVGEGLPMIGKLLGHTQVQTTARYAHLASDPLKAAATKIADRLSQALTTTAPLGLSGTTIPTATEAGLPVESAVAIELAAYRRALRLIVEDRSVNGGLPTFRGTFIPVLPIAEIARAGVTLTDLKRDFPRLTDEMFEAAHVFLRVYAA